MEKLTASDIQQTGDGWQITTNEKPILAGRVISFENGYTAALVKEQVWPESMTPWILIDPDGVIIPPTASSARVLPRWIKPRPKKGTR
jgi:hypothetical protein